MATMAVSSTLGALQKRSEEEEKNANLDSQLSSCTRSSWKPRTQNSADRWNDEGTEILNLQDLQGATETEQEFSPKGATMAG